jgi:Probable zinc-ribbon domain
MTPDGVMFCEDYRVKSNKQRRKEIMARCHMRAVSNVAHELRFPCIVQPLDAVPANPARLAHNNTRDLLPAYYVDRPFNCRDCGSQELWTATQQKWWYEEIGGQIDSVAVRCLPCRRAHQAQRAAVRKAHLEGVAAKRLRV